MLVNDLTSGLLGTIRWGIYRLSIGATNFLELPTEFFEMLDGNCISWQQIHTQFQLQELLNFRFECLRISN